MAPILPAEKQIAWEKSPELNALCWNLHVPKIGRRVALRLYEDNWRFVNQTAMPRRERQLVNGLAARYGSYLHV